MRAYRVSIDEYGVYGDAEKDRWGSSESLRKQHPDELPMLYRELDKAAVVIGYRPRFESDSAAFTVMVFDRPFVDNTAYVRELVCRARDIWDLGFVEDLAPHLEVEEIDARSAIRGEGLSYNGLERSQAQKASLLELHFLLHTALRGPIQLNSYPSTLHASREETLQIAGESLYSRSLTRELEAIYRGRTGDADGAPRIPVHYILEGAGGAGYESALDLLVNALDSTGRAPSRCVLHMRFEQDTVTVSDPAMYRTVVNERLMRALSDNILLIEYGELDASGSYDHKLYAMFSDMLNAVGGHLETTQVIVLVPPACEELKELVRSKLRAPVVDIALDRDTAGWGQSAAYDELRSLAKAEGLAEDDNLVDLLARHGCHQTGCSVGQIFDEWRKLERTREAYPQYREAVERFGCHGLTAEEAYRQLDDLVGLEEPKRLIREVVQRLKTNNRLMKAGLPTRPFSMHMAFLGSPGTGKTEVARLYGAILRAEGVLPEGRLFVEAGPGMPFHPKWEKYVGSVLFIDEAYAMDCDVASLIAFMENHREDTVVILAGYPGHMAALLSSNPGFRSRIGFTVTFPDYSVEQMADIFEAMAHSADVALEDGARAVLLDELTRGGRRADQGNARFVRKLFEDALGVQQVRIAKRCGDEPAWEPTREEIQLLLCEDIAEAERRRRVDCTNDENDVGTGREQLDALIGLGSVKRVIGDYLAYARVRKLRRDRGLKAGFVPLHMAFLGNPGTGKTEVARLVAKILREEGILSVGELYECSRADLVCPPLTTDLVNALFSEARGSVIFIDEAYSLTYPGGDEAITAIVDNMEKLRDEVVVIFAGYTAEVADLISLNPGLDSRVKAKVSFPDYSPRELWEILTSMAGKRGFTLTDDVEAVFMDEIKRASQRKGFGNARTARTILEEAVLAQGARIARETDDLSTVPDDDEYLMTLTAADFAERMRSDEDAGKKLIGFGL